MKKNISINISGIIFHIEEDGYDRLSNYLESIQKYFSHYEDSKEILEDIESRIAEIFLAKLTDDKQVITSEDVESLITTMGTIADFDATIDVDEEDLVEETVEDSTTSQSTGSSGEEKKSSTSSSKSKRLTRAKNKRVIGGVASGLAHYFNIDPIWVRLIFIAFFVNFFVGGFMLFTLIVYVILWVVMPEEEIEEDEKSKKLYRDSEDRVLGGVASGLAAYFGTDVIIIRILFVLSIFLGGSGFFIYLVLWIITPEATTITEKMQMQGEPVTLSNIESNIKESLDVKEGEENVLVKILLFPFRVIAAVISGLGKALGPLARFAVDIIRVFIGAILFIVGLSAAISMVVAVATFFGVSGEWSEMVRMGDIPEPFVTMRTMFPDVTVIFGFLSGIIPALILIMAGISIMVNKMVIKGYAIWSFLGIWLIGLVGLAITVPSAIYNMHEDGYIKETKEYKLEEGTPYLTVNFLERKDSGARLKLRGHEGPDFKLLTEFSANGKDREDAKDNASMMTYTVEQKDSVFTFDSNYKIKDIDEFQYRFQEVSAIFYIPYNTVFRMDQDLDEILHNTLNLNGYSSYQISGNDWVFTEEGISCLTCEPVDAERDRYIPGSDRRDFDMDNYSGELTVYEFSNFNRIKANGLFEIKVIQTDSFDVQVSGPSHVMDDVDIFENNGKLVFDYDGDWDWWKRRSRYSKVGVTISMPELQSVDLSGASKMYIESFEASDMSVDVSGASFFQANMVSDELSIDMAGASKVNLRGKTRTLNADISGASNLEAENLDADYVDLEASGASRAKVFGSREIEIDAGGASQVKYGGTGNTDISKGGGSSVKKGSF